MKVLFPIGSFFPSQDGGPSNTIYWLSKELKLKGITPIIITTDSGIKSGQVILNKWLNIDCGRVLYCKTRFHYLPLKLIWNSIIEIRKVDIIHLTALFYPPSLLLASIGKIYNKKIIWSVRGELANAALLYSSYIKKMYLILIKLLINDRFIFHTTSIQEKQNLTNNFGHHVKVSLIPNLIKLPKLLEPNLQGGNKYFIYIGRIHPIKALDKLIAALTLSKEFGKSNFHFYLAGTGDLKYLNLLMEFINENHLQHKVIFLGEVRGEEKEKLFANAELSFLVSESENFGNVVIESLAQSTPVVTSIGTPWEILKENNAGYWIDNSPETIANAIDHFLNLSNLERSSMRENSIKLVKEKFDIQNNISQWISFYNITISA